MCYPYGASDQSALALLKNRNCSVALTTRPAVARLETDDPLLLPRIGTNDVPM
jgi:hypothetical protein